MPRIWSVKWIVRLYLSAIRILGQVAVSKFGVFLLVEYYVFGSMAIQYNKDNTRSLVISWMTAHANQNGAHIDRPARETSIRKYRYHHHCLLVLLMRYYDGIDENKTGGKGNNWYRSTYAWAAIIRICWWRHTPTSTGIGPSRKHRCTDTQILHS